MSTESRNTSSDPTNLSLFVYFRCCRGVKYFREINTLNSVARQNYRICPSSRCRMKAILDTRHTIKKQTAMEQKQSGALKVRLFFYILIIGYRKLVFCSNLHHFRTKVCSFVKLGVECNSLKCVKSKLNVIQDQLWAAREMVGIIQILVLYVPHIRSTVPRY